MTSLSHLHHLAWDLKGGKGEPGSVYVCVGPYYQEPWERFIDGLKSKYGASAISTEILPGLRTKALNQPSVASPIHAGQSPKSTAELHKSRR